MEVSSEPSKAFSVKASPWDEARHNRVNYSSASPAFFRPMNKPFNSVLIDW